jgi:hypothetical protein
LKAKFLEIASRGSPWHVSARRVGRISPGTTFCRKILLALIVDTNRTMRDGRYTGSK